MKRGGGRARGTPSAPRSALLTPKQQRFALEYLQDLNGKQAAIRAGYSEATAESQASRLLRNAKVQNLLEEKLRKVEAKAEVNLERILLELHRILLADPADALNENGGVLPLKEWPEDLRRALSGLDVEEIWEGRGPARDQVGEVKKLRYWSKTHASEQLLRVLGAFKDKVEHEVIFKSHAELVAEAARRAREKAAEARA